MIIADSRLVSAEQETFSWVETTLIVKLTCQDSLAGAEVLARWGNMLLPLFSFSYTRCILCSGYLCFQLFCRYKFSNNFFSRSLGVSQHSNVVHLGACLSIILILLDCRIIETSKRRSQHNHNNAHQWMKNSSFWYFQPFKDKRSMNHNLESKMDQVNIRSAWSK